MYGGGSLVWVCFGILGLGFLTLGAEPGATIGLCVHEFLDKINKIHCILGLPGKPTEKADRIIYDIRNVTKPFLPPDVCCSSSNLIRTGKQRGSSTKCTAYTNGTTESTTDIQTDKCAIISVEGKLTERHVIYYDKREIAIVYTCTRDPNASKDISPAVMMKAERNYTLTPEDIKIWDYVRNELGLGEIIEYPQCTTCI